MTLKPQLIKPLLVCIVVSVFFLNVAYAQSVVSVEQSAPVKTKAKKKTLKAKSRHQVSSIKFLPGSQETTKERSTRLLRECKGAVNAGACEGYTR